VTLKRSLKIIQTSTIRIESLGAVAYSLSIVMHHLRDKARYWSKIVIFHITFAFDAPVFRQVPVGILPSRLVWKTRMVGHGEKNFETEYRRVTDGHLATALSALCIR